MILESLCQFRFAQPSHKGEMMSNSPDLILLCCHCHSLPVDEYLVQSIVSRHLQSTKDMSSFAPNLTGNSVPKAVSVTKIHDDVPLSRSEAESDYEEVSLSIKKAPQV